MSPLLSSLPALSATNLSFSASSLLDLIDSGGDKESTNRIRQAIKLALRKGVPITVTTGVKILPESKWSLSGGGGRGGMQKGSMAELGLKRTQLRLTPCVDRDGTVSAYIGLMSVSAAAFSERWKEGTDAFGSVAQ